MHLKDGNAAPEHQENEAAEGAPSFPVSPAMSPKSWSGSQPSARINGADGVAGSQRTRLPVRLDEPP